MSEPLILFFDADCLMCSGSVRLIHSWDDEDRIRFSALAGETAQKLGIPNGETIVLLKGEERFEKSEAVRVSLLEVYPVIGILFGFVPRKLRDWGYDFIAARRQKISKLAPVCEIPDPRMTAKILP